MDREDPPPDAAHCHGWPECPIRTGHGNAASHHRSCDSYVAPACSSSSGLTTEQFLTSSTNWPNASLHALTRRHVRLLSRTSPGRLGGGRLWWHLRPLEGRLHHNDQAEGRTSNITATDAAPAAIRNRALARSLRIRSAQACHSCHRGVRATAAVHRPMDRRVVPRTHLPMCGCRRALHRRR
jgi:hypothetical protein